jgi:hypothetical protein
MIYNKNKVKESLVIALKDLELQPEVISDSVFHMTDWLDDLEEWHSFCKNPDKLTSEKLQELLLGFLAHVPNHLAAASKLITDIPVSDIFNVGSTVESEE